MTGPDFRPWRPDDVPFLWDMLHASLHVRAGQPPFPRSVLADPGIAHYLVDFGASDGDDAQLATVDGARVGAAWCRRLPAEDPGYGFVDASVPELGMAVLPEHRGRGIGRRLITDLLARHPAMSLSVDDENDVAGTLYRSLGFEPVATDGGSTTMLRSAAGERT